MTRVKICSASRCGNSDAGIATTRKNLGGAYTGYPIGAPTGSTGGAIDLSQNLCVFLFLRVPLPYVCNAAGAVPGFLRCTRISNGHSTPFAKYKHSIERRRGGGGGDLANRHALSDIHAAITSCERPAAHRASTVTVSVTHHPPSAKSAWRSRIASHPHASSAATCIGGRHQSLRIKGACRLPQPPDLIASSLTASPSPAHLRQPPVRRALCISSSSTTSLTLRPTCLPTPPRPFRPYLSHMLRLRTLCHLQRHPRRVSAVH